MQYHSLAGACCDGIRSGNLKRSTLGGAKARPAAMPCRLATYEWPQIGGVPGDEDRVAASPLHGPGIQDERTATE